MSPALYATLWIALGFLCGSIPFGYLVARAKGMDIRTQGSGNIGMTNVWRTLGAKYGVLVLLLDALKGFVPVLLLLLLPGPGWKAVIPTASSQQEGAALDHVLSLISMLPMFVGLAAMLGHAFTPWLKFKGGKGVATGLGVILALFQVWALIPLGVFLLTLALSRYVSLGSLLAAIAVCALPLVYGPLLSGSPLAGAGGFPILSPLWPFGLLVALIVIYAHRENIKRILNGTERKVGAKPT